MILSVSRRTDVPAFYGQWFLNRLKEGAACYKNPFNSRQVYQVPLDPKVIDCIVFWTKNPGPFFEFLPEVADMGYTYTFQFTLTPYGKEIEPGLPSKEEMIKKFQILSQRIGPDKIFWRYDPVIFTEAMDVSWHEAQFQLLCESLAGYTRSCTVSFLDFYPGIMKRLSPIQAIEGGPSACSRLIQAFVKTGQKYNIGIKVCCEKEDYTKYGAAGRPCIDLEEIQQAIGHQLKINKDKNQRKGCGCIQSVDIGAYNTCIHGCIYCYAVKGGSGAADHYKRHDPFSPLLAGTIDKGCTLTHRKLSSNKI